MKKWQRFLTVCVWVALVALILVHPALAHDAPDDGAEWLLADWMLLSFLIFAGAAFLTFLAVVKAGLLRNIEDAKYYILTIDEPDYYTPDWAKEGPDAD